MTQFQDYDRVADTLLYLSDNFTLDFVVVLSTKDKAGARSFFHSESDYESNKYIDRTSLKSIKRKLTFYFVITNKQSFDGGFLLRPQDVQIMNMMITQKVLPWFFDPKKRLFKVIDNKLVIVGDFTPAEYIRNSYQFISIEPCVYSYDDNTYKEGVRMHINNDYVDMDIDKFMGFYYILTNTDMYSAACNIVTYVKTQPYDVNVWKKYGLAGAISTSQDDRIWNTDTVIDNSNNEKKRGNAFLDNIKPKK